MWDETSRVVFHSLQHSIILTFDNFWSSRKIGLILTDQRFYCAEQMASRAENTKHFQEQRTHFENCAASFWRLLRSILVWYSLHPFAKTLNRGKSASITLLWNKSRQIAFFFFLADPFLGRCNLGCRGFWKKRRKSDWSATVLSRRRKKQWKKRTSPKRPIRSIQEGSCDDPGQSGWMTGGGEYKEG